MNTHTDFADELLDKNSKDEYKLISKKSKNITMNIIDILKEKNSFSKEKGRYISVEFNNLLDDSTREKVSKVLIEAFNSLYKIKSNDKVLIVGLGNDKIIADALGPIVADKIMVTNHLFINKENINKSIKRVCVFTPKVMGQTGLESADLILAVNNLFKPNLIIIVDSLATSSLIRINKVIQLSNVGITPGSGVGNYRKEISEKNLHTKIITIGVATVMEASNIIKELSNIKIPKDSNYSLVLTPKEIDENIEHLATIISSSINQYIHENFSKL